MLWQFNHFAEPQATTDVQSDADVRAVVSSARFVLQLLALWRERSSSDFSKWSSVYRRLAFANVGLDMDVVEVSLPRGNEVAVVEVAGGDRRNVIIPQTP